MALLSIVVPFYGVERYIAECLESLRVQTFRDFEVVLVDDESPDNSREIALQYVERDPRFRLVTKKNQGIGPARNTGAENAQGKYLAFVDSDDIVAPRAYSLLVDTLELTGSDLGGGNARRFSDHTGSRQSWTHAQAFAHTRLATSIRDFPVLIRDRMVWNKVYRRSYWDEFGFTFPAMQYEDYPVALQTQLEARAVDVHSAHVYYWRDRQSGDSITQQVFKPSNARDRVKSAHMVLDMIEPDASDDIVRQIHAYFVDVDLVALAGALAVAPPENQTELADLAQGLARRLVVQPPGDVARLARLIHLGLLSGDLDFVRALARWREGGGTKALVSELAHAGNARQLGPVLSAVTRRRKIKNPAAPRRLRAELEGSTVVGSDLHLTVGVLLRGQFASRVDGRVEMVTPSARLRLSTTYEQTSDGLRLEVVVPGGKLASLADPSGSLEISLALGPLRWRGKVTVPLESVPALWHASRDVALQPCRLPDSQYLGIRAVPHPMVAITGVTATETGFTLTLSESDGDLVVALPYPEQDLVLPIRDGKVGIDVARLQSSDVPDNPVTREVERPLGYRPTAVADAVRFHGTFETDKTRSDALSNALLDSTDWEALVRPYLSGRPCETLLGDEVASLRPDADGYVVLRRAPLAAHPQAADEPSVAAIKD